MNLTKSNNSDGKKVGELKSFSLKLIPTGTRSESSAMQTFD